MPRLQHIFLSAFTTCALLTGACSAGGAARPESAGTAPPALANASVLSSSEPANGAKLRSAPERLVFNFTKPVRLVEVTVTGSDGSVMPMMVSSAGANSRYELPLDGLERGSYTVRWRAVDEASIQHEGSIAFEIA